VISGKFKTGVERRERRGGGELVLLPGDNAHGRTPLYWHSRLRGIGYGWPCLSLRRRLGWGGKASPVVEAGGNKCPAYVRHFALGMLFTDRKGSCDPGGPFG
jgi:hypothetical protein